MKTYIDLIGLKMYCNHGVLPQERVVGNLFGADLRLYYDASEAMATDCIDAALNYAAVTEVVKAQMAIPSALIEHVAARVVNAVRAEFPIVTSGRVTITKFHPPISSPTPAASFTIEW